MLLDDTATYVAANTTRLDVGTNLTKSFMPDSPDTVTTFYESGGSFPLHYFTTSTGTRSYEQPSLQVITRSADYQTARSTIEDVFTILDGTANTTLPTATGVDYVSVDAIQSPFLIDRDSNDRFRLGVNFSIIKTTG
jgi:hypothetical protein